MAELKRGTATTFLPTPGPYLAIITNHLDPSYMGALEVAILKKTTAGMVQDSETHVVQYISPFAGNTATVWEGNDSADYGSVQKSYGFWAVPPDLGSTVMVIFIDGDPNQGYWFGCTIDRYQNFTVPGFAATQNVEITPDQEKYFGTKLLPTGEFLKKTQGNSTETAGPKISSINKPIHPFAERLLSQGLLLDTVRGVTSSSARREIPSAVFGMSTPGPLDNGGSTTNHITNSSPKKTIPGTDPSQGQQSISRLGGSSFVMDDGDQNGENELVRIRTRTGHQILMHNSQDLIYIANSQGTAWIELTSNGKIDIYAYDSISIHSEGDFNFRADRDVNIEAGRNVNMYSGQDYQFDVKGDLTLNVTGKGLFTLGETLDVNATDTIKMTSSGQIHLKSSNQTYISAGSDFNITAGADGYISTTGNFNQTAADWKVTASGSTNITSSHHIETAGTIDMNGPSAAGATASTPADQAAQATALQTFYLPNRNFDNGWENGKFYKAEDISSIMLRVPTFEPWDQHENIDRDKFSRDATDISFATGVSTVSSSGKIPKGSPAVPQTSTTNTKYNGVPATSGTPPAKTGDIAQDNIAAFLWMIRNCEGTSGPTGYQTMFTGKLFSDFSKHPNQAITAGVNGKGLTSTAAGAYQFLYTTWVELSKQLNLPDFSPASQDQGCIQLLKRRGALDDIKAGRFTQAVIKCNKEWASLPGSPYNQHPKDMSVALNFIKTGGGTVVA